MSVRVCAFPARCSNLEEEFCGQALVLWAGVRWGWCLEGGGSQIVASLRVIAAFPSVSCTSSGVKSEFVVTQVNRNESSRALHGAGSHLMFFTR